MKSLSIIIPVLNEASVINRTIARLMNVKRNGIIEIIVVDGSPDKGTIRTIESKEVIKLASPKGRGVQMNAGAVAATGDILLFLHADTILPHHSCDDIFFALKKSDAVGGAFRLGIRSRRGAFRLIEFVANIRTHISRIPYGDQAIFIRSNFFHKVGGYKEIPIMEDVELMRRIKQTGNGIIILPAQVQTSARRWEKEGVVYGTLRNWSLMTLFLLGASPETLAKFYR
jgi:rSAM/selenodomain-associated transferase 2